jgi:Uma2 family endonuclease
VSMAALPDPPLMSVEEYLATSFPDGDREYLDGIVVERNLGTNPHSALQAVLVEYLSSRARSLGLAVRPECRTKVNAARYRVPDILVVARPFNTVRGVIVDAPFLIVEILSPDDRVSDTVKRYRDYEALGVRHIVQLDPVDRTTFSFEGGALAPRDLEGFEVPGRGRLAFNVRELFERLDEELA